MNSAPFGTLLAPARAGNLARAGVLALAGTLALAPADPPALAPAAQTQEVP